MIYGSDPVAAAKDNAGYRESLARGEAKLATARSRYEGTTRNLDGDTIRAIEHGTITDAECEASSVVSAARQAWRDYLALTHGAIVGDGNIHIPS